jgi:hypothetical protein
MLEVADLLDGLEWIIAGAQMVILLERERGIASGRTTGDVDAVVGGPRAVAATSVAAGRLRAAGFERSAEHAQRFTRGADQVDLLTVDHLRSGPRSRSSDRGGLTSVPGGRRAISTARRLDIEVVGLGQRRLPVPTVAGALAMKLRALETRGAERDLEDLVRLLAIVEDAAAVRSELKPAERRMLGGVAALRDPNSAAWRSVGSSQDARAAWLRLRDE